MQNYKQAYLNRPLLPRKADTYLELTSFLCQMVPTYLTHYHQHLTPQELGILTEHLNTLHTDLTHKIKTLSLKLEQKEQSQPQRQSSHEICRVCLKELRTIEVAHAKEEL